MFDFSSANKLNVFGESNTYWNDRCWFQNRIFSLPKLSTHFWSMYYIKKSRWNSSASRITIFIPNIYKKWFSFFFYRAKQMFSAELFKNSILQVISISKCHTLNVQIQKKSYLWTKIDIITICTKPWAELLWYIRHNTFAYLTRVTQPFQHTYSSRLV